MLFLKPNGDIMRVEQILAEMIQKWVGDTLNKEH
jgi:hypothetical protein